jgi:L-threonylcarbamoyladenylate synthase
MTTRILETSEPDEFNTAVNEAVELLRAGEVVALPTETVYGLAADALNADAVAKIFAAKERPAFDPLIIHLPHRKNLSEVADVPAEIAEQVKAITTKFWPGALTLVLPKAAAVPDAVTSGLPTVAVRVSGDPVFMRVCRLLERPLAAPSANRFGRISPTSAGAVLAELDGRIPLILNGGASGHGIESTIIKVEPGLQGKALLTVLRPGPITLDDLKDYGIVKIGYKRGKKNETKTAEPTLEAPGMLDSHYAPATPLRLLSSPEEFQPEEGKRYALLSYRGESDDGYLDLAEWEGMHILTPGKGKLIEAATRLYYALRELDKLGVDEIIAEPVAEQGIGAAIMDRLRRASGKREPAAPPAAHSSQPPNV